MFWLNASLVINWYMHVHLERTIKPSLVAANVADQCVGVARRWSASNVQLKANNTCISRLVFLVQVWHSFEIFRKHYFHILTVCICYAYVWLNRFFINSWNLNSMQPTRWDITTSGLAAAIMLWWLPVAPGSFRYSAVQFPDSENMGLPAVSNS